MRYKLFGNSGLRVSELCLGTMNFGTALNWGVDAKRSASIVDTFANAGGNYIDTADGYADGQSESYLGDILSSQREHFVVSTKYSLMTDPDSVNGFGNSRKHLVSSVERSLKRLNTEYIDIFWVHCWDYMTRVEEIMRTLNDLVSQGKIHHLGLSNAPSWILAEGNTLAQNHGWCGFSGLQLEYSLAQRSIEAEYFPLLEAFDLNLSAWSPLAGGILSGKYQQQRLDTHSRFDAIGLDVSATHEALVTTASAIASELGCTLPQLALAWVKKNNARIIPIIGASRPEQLEENLGCLEVQLSEQHYANLKNLNKHRPQEPYGILSRQDQLQRTYGDYLHRIDNHRYRFPV